ncbi:MAG: LysM peptidoglycan-binding domain-containing protein [Chloroflexi bacterium]|nr:LysM peptidoglycan-binding domain-containing protein [Chloroflexota bacterium]MBI3341072.1 LysM peptidoglycan-binding domain-containing protein [Chloroflexota bacterium]
MTPEPTSPKTLVCPTCGTRLSDTAARCPVCGTDLSPKSKTSMPTKKVEQSMQASRMPEVTLSLPIALGLLVLFLVVGATVVYVGLSAAKRVVVPTQVPTQTETPTASPSPTETLPPTFAPTATEQPPFEYTIALGDTCGGIAITFGVSVQSIIILNNLPAQCTNLVVGQKLKVPYPTPTALPVATNTFQPADATRAACEKVNVTVQENDTLSSIAANYAVPMQAIKDFNGLSTDNVFTGQTLTIPLCARAATPGPTPTATIPPPYPAPNLLLPGDGAAFTLANDVVTLQWASIGTLRDNETYQVTIEDVTAGQARRIVDFVADTKYIVPTSFRPKDTVAHVLRWWVTPVRQTGTDDQGQPIYTSAGATSDKRVFTWVGAAVDATPTP